jgi:hypothetical protein
VPEERSAALQNVSRMGSNNTAREAIVCWRSSPPTSSKRVLFPGNTIDYAQPNYAQLDYAQPKALLRAIHIAVKVLFHLLSYVNCSYSIHSISPFDFYFSCEGAV